MSYLGTDEFFDYFDDAPERSYQSKWRWASAAILLVCALAAICGYYQYSKQNDQLRNLQQIKLADKPYFFEVSDDVYSGVNNLRSQNQMPEMKRLSNSIDNNAIVDFCSEETWNKTYSMVDCQTLSNKLSLKGVSFDQFKLTTNNTRPTDSQILHSFSKQLDEAKDGKHGVPPLALSIVKTKFRIVMTGNGHSDWIVTTIAM